LFYEYVIGLKKLATLLPNYWLAEKPQTLGEEAWQAVGERERISEINWNIILLKTVGKFEVDNYQKNQKLLLFLIKL